MQRIFLFIITLFCTLYACAQNRIVDSINAALAKATTDTARINLMNAKANTYIRINLDTAILIANDAIARSEKIQYMKGKADGYKNVAGCLVRKSAFAAALPKYKVAEALYTQLKDSNGLNSLYSNYGMYYGMQSKYDSSIDFYKKVINYDERNNKEKNLGSDYQNIAVSYSMLSNYQQALYYQSKALHLAERLKDTLDLAYINLNMAINYSNVYDYERAEILSNKAIVYAQQAQSKNVELYGYANLAATRSELKKYAESYADAMKAVELGKQLGDYAMVASSMARAGEALAYEKKYAGAEQLATQSIAIADTAGSPLNVFQTFIAMGLIKKLQQQYAEAIKYYEKGFVSLKETDLYDAQTGDAYSGLSESYEHAGMYQQALAAFKTASKISDSIHSRENIRKATELSMNYDFSKKEQAMQAEQDKQNTTASARQLALLIGLGCTLLLIAGSLFAYRQKQKANVKLLSQQKELRTTFNQLKAAQSQLIQSEKMASLGELTAGIAHEIQNPLNFVNNFSEINKELLEELTAAVANGNADEVKTLAGDIISNEQKINYHGRRADAIVKGMLQHSRKSNGQKELTDFNALCDEYLRLSYYGLRAKDKNFNADFKTNFDKLIGKVSIVPQDFGRVLLNLFNNAFYAVNEKKKLSANSYQPAVSVQTKKINNTIEIIVKDNGNGIPQNISDKIFQPFFTTKPTGEGTGLGLSLSYDIIKAHGGEINVETKEGEGSCFRILLPA